MMLMAHYRCQVCGESWHQLPGPTVCDRCGSLYVLWVNFKAMADAGFNLKKYNANMNQAKAVAQEPPNKKIETESTVVKVSEQNLPSLREPEWATSI